MSAGLPLRPAGMQRKLARSPRDGGKPGHWAGRLLAAAKAIGGMQQQPAGRPDPDVGDRARAPLRRPDAAREKAEAGRTPRGKASAGGWSDDGGGKSWAETGTPLPAGRPLWKEKDQWLAAVWVVARGGWWWARAEDAASRG